MWSNSSLSPIAAKDIPGRQWSQNSHDGTHAHGRHCVDERWSTRHAKRADDQRPDSAATASLRDDRPRTLDDLSDGSGTTLPTPRQYRRPRCRLGGKRSSRVVAQKNREPPGAVRAFGVTRSLVSGKRHMAPLTRQLAWESAARNGAFPTAPIASSLPRTSRRNGIVKSYGQCRQHPRGSRLRACRSLSVLERTQVADQHHHHRREHLLEGHWLPLAVATSRPHLTHQRSRRIDRGGEGFGTTYSLPELAFCRLKLARATRARRFPFLSGTHARSSRIPTSSSSYTARSAHRPCSSVVMSSPMS